MPILELWGIFPLLPGHSYLFHSREIVRSLGKPQKLPLSAFSRIIGSIGKLNLVQMASGKQVWGGRQGPRTTESEDLVGSLGQVPYPLWAGILPSTKAGVN